MIELNKDGIKYLNNDLNYLSIRNVLFGSNNYDTWYDCPGHPDIKLTTMGKLKISDRLKNQGGAFIFTKGRTIYIQYYDQNHNKGFWTLKLRNIFFSLFISINKIKCDPRNNKFKDINNLFSIDNLVYSEPSGKTLTDDDFIPTTAQLLLEDKTRLKRIPFDHPTRIWNLFPKRTKVQDGKLRSQGPAYGLTL